MTDRQNQGVEDNVVRRIIASLGFPADRVERAIACLLTGEASHEDGMDQVLSFKEVQQHLGISKSGLRRIMAANKLMPIDITKRRIGFSAKDVAAFIEASKRRSPSCPEPQSQSPIP